MSTVPAQIQIPIPHSSPQVPIQKTQTQILHDIITTPYMKVLSILNEAKKVISISCKSQIKLVRNLEWAIGIITNHSLYTYEFVDPDSINSYKKENEQFKKFIDFVKDYNEKVIEINKKNNLVMTKSAELENEIKLLHVPSHGMKNTKLLQKKNQGGNGGFMFKTNKKNTNILKKYEKFGNKISINFNSNNTNNNLIINNNTNLINISNSINDNIISNTQNEISTDLINKIDSTSSNKLKRNLTPGATDNKISTYKKFLSVDDILNKFSYDTKKILTREFDIFELKSIVGYENVLPLMGKTILDAFNIINDEIINTSKLEHFLNDISSNYHQTVLYHNAIHGADVTHTICLFFLNSNAEETVCTNVLDIMSIIIASLGHDIGHPGFTNNFQINSQSEMALTYNDISCLENFHTSKLFNLMRKPENNIIEKLSVEDFKSLRKRMVSMILATDMANHGEVMSHVKARAEIEGDIVIKNPVDDKEKKDQFKQQQNVLDYFIHAADLAHNTKSFKLSLHWVELLSNEYWEQGDKEIQLNLPVSFLCSRENVDIPNSQIGFIRGFILPTFDVMVKLFPQLSYTYETAEVNLERWKELKAEGRVRGWTPEKERKKKEENKESNNTNNVNININLSKSLKENEQIKGKKTMTISSNLGNKNNLLTVNYTGKNQTHTTGDKKVEKKERSFSGVENCNKNTNFAPKNNDNLISIKKSPTYKARKLQLINNLNNNNGGSVSGSGSAKNPVNVIKVGKCDKGNNNSNSNKKK